MPEKVHMKFGGDKPTQTNHSNSNSSSKAPKPVPSSNNSSHSNGSKRNRDGTSKDAHHKSSKDSKSVKSSSHTAHQTNGTSREKDDTDERPRKTKKHNEDPPRPFPTKQKLLAGLEAQRARGPGFDKAKLAKFQRIRKDLPMWTSRSNIRYALRNHNVLLLTGETGSGKSTQTPQYLYEEPWCVRQMVEITNEVGVKEQRAVGGMVAITQPRRIAAMTLAQRVAAEMNEPFKVKGRNDGKVGYAVRFDKYVTKDTKIKFVTEGVLLQEMLHDPNLLQYSCVIVDEIHERSVDVDLIAGFLRNIVHGNFKGRGGVPLKVVVMSATFDLGGYEAFFAMPESRPDYQPGKNYGRILNLNLSHLPVDPNLASPDRWSIDREDIEGGDSEEQKSTEGDTSFSSWDGISDDDSPKEKTVYAKAITPKPNGTPKSTKEPESKSAKKPKHGEPALPETPENTRREKVPRFESKKEILSMVALNGVAIEKVKGRKFEVEHLMLPKPPEDMLRDILVWVLKVHLAEPLPGDILVFLTGQDDIETLKSQLETYIPQLTKGDPRFEVMGLYGSMPANLQAEVFKPFPNPGKVRKIVLATNIAETSVTVPGVRFVIDCGKAKVKQYRPKLGMESLLSKPISKISAIQRMGRAGREAKGKCWRMYTEDDWEKMDMDELPEILRCDVIEAVLKMMARGVVDVPGFPLMDSPKIESIRKAFMQLIEMGAVGEDGRLNDVGKKMASFPLPAAYGRVIIAASEPGNDIVLETVDVIACLTTDSEIFQIPRDMDQQDALDDMRNDITRREGDIITLLTTMQKYASMPDRERSDWCKKRLISVRALKTAMNIRQQLRDQCLEHKLLAAKPPADPLPFEPITPERAGTLLKTFLSAFNVKTAVMEKNGKYETLLGRNEISIHPSSVLFQRKAEAIMFLEHVYTSKNYAKKVSAIQRDWIKEPRA